MRLKLVFNRCNSFVIQIFFLWFNVTVLLSYLSTHCFICNSFVIRLLSYALIYQFEYSFKYFFWNNLLHFSRNLCCFYMNILGICTYVTLLLSYLFIHYPTCNSLVIELYRSLIFSAKREPFSLTYVTVWLYENTWYWWTIQIYINKQLHIFFM